MSDIVAFLRARLDERMLVALPHHEDCGGGLPDWPKIDGCDCGAKAEEHLVYREVEAKRRRVTILDAERRAGLRRGSGQVGLERWQLADELLGLEALPHADHPDYDPEWRLQAASTS